MRAVDHSFQVIGTAVGVVRRIHQDAVIAPASLSGKLCYRHKFDRGDAELREMIQLCLDACESASLGKRAGMQFVDYSLMPRPPAPAAFGPLVAGVIDHKRRAMYIILLGTGRRIRDRLAIIEHEGVSFTGPDRVVDVFAPAIADLVHREGCTGCRILE